MDKDRNKYKDRDTVSNDYRKLKINKKEIKNIIKWRFNDHSNYVVYENSQCYQVYEFHKLYVVIISIILYPLLMFMYGIFGLRELNREMYNSVFKKKTGTVTSYIIYKDDENKLK